MLTLLRIPRIGSTLNILRFVVLSTIYLLVYGLGLNDRPSVVSSGGLIAAWNGLALSHLHTKQLVLVLRYSLSVLGCLYS